MAYEDFKDMPRRTVLDKVFGDKAFNVAKNRKYHNYQSVLRRFINVLIKKLLLYI